MDSIRGLFGNIIESSRRSVLSIISIVVLIFDLSPISILTSMSKRLFSVVQVLREDLSQQCKYFEKIFLINTSTSRRSLSATEIFREYLSQQCKCSEKIFDNRKHSEKIFLGNTKYSEKIFLGNEEYSEKIFLSNRSIPRRLFSAMEVFREDPSQQWNISYFTNSSSILRLV